MPQIHSLLETALYVADLQTSANFYRRVFNFETLLESDKLIALDVAGRSVLLLFKQGATTNAAKVPGGVIPGHGTTGSAHFAFGINANELDQWREHLAVHNVAIESEVAWPGGAHSLYFRDPDNHLAELITRGFWRTY